MNAARNQRRGALQGDFDFWHKTRTLCHYTNLTVGIIEKPVSEKFNLTQDPVVDLRVAIICTLYTL